MLEILHNKPLILTVDNFLCSNTCSTFLEHNWNWKRSGGYDHATQSSKETPERTSSTTFISLKDPKLPQTIKELNKKVSEFFKIEYSRLESPQLQRYESGQEYVPHWDYFFNGAHTNNNRVSTVIIYLNEDFTGGTTSFLKLNKSVKPKQGRALYFEYDYTSSLNSLTMHSGDTVIEGTKYIITIWIRKSNWP